MQELLIVLVVLLLVVLLLLVVVTYIALALRRLHERLDAHEQLRQLVAKPEPPDGDQPPRFRLIAGTAMAVAGTAKVVTDWSREHPVASVIALAGVSATLVTAAACPWPSNPTTNPVIASPPPITLAPKPGPTAPTPAPQTAPAPAVLPVPPAGIGAGGNTAPDVGQPVDMPATKPARTRTARKPRPAAPAPASGPTGTGPTPPGAVPPAPPASAPSTPPTTPPAPPTGPQPPPSCNGLSLPITLPVLGECLL